MITESSRDFNNRTVLILFEGETPSVEQIKEYVRQQYNTEPCYCRVNGIEQPSEFFGLKNPGTVSVKLLPSATDLEAIDFTSGVDPVEYVRSLRD